MAAVAKSAENDLSCPVCYELLVDPNTPKNLPLCGHVCCEVCLKKMVAGRRICPECRQVIKIPKGGIASFTTNYRLRNLAENFQSNSLQTKDQVPQGGVPLCPDHYEEKMHFYCVTCNNLACQACLILKHNGTGHSIEGIKEIYEMQKHEMESAATRAETRIADDEEIALCKLETAEIENAELNFNVKKQIDECIESHMNKLLSKGEELKSQVEREMQMRSDDLTRESATVHKHIKSAKESYQAIVSASENLPDYEYITQHTQLVNKMEEIPISKPTTLASKTKLDVIKFVPSSSQTKLGHIISVTPGKVRTVKKIQTSDGLIGACRVDCNPDGLFAVADFDENKVVIYHKVNDKYERKLDLQLAQDNHHEPFDIVICPDGRFMVARFTCIEVYSPEGQYQNDIEINGLDEVHRVKVTSNGRIFVGDYNGSLFIEISPTGNVIRTIHTRIQPRHMTLIHDTHIAISDHKAGNVVVIDIESGQETLSIDIPWVQGICYDEHTDCLLIARIEQAGKPGRIYPNTGIIDQYNYTTGKLVACLQQGLYCPYGMALTSDGHLFVANTKSVEIYEIQ